MINIEKITSLTCHVTNICNLKCRHCWVEASSDIQSDELLSIDEWKKAIDEAVDLGAVSLKFTGGEPLCYKRFVELLSYAKNKQLVCSLETNGTLIDKEMAMFLKNKLNHVAVSLDAPSAEYHDWFRVSKGCWNTAVNGIRLLVKEDIRTQIIFSLSKETIKFIPDMIEFSLKENVKSIKINPISAAGRAINNVSYTIFDIDDYITIHHFVEKQKQKSEGIAIFFPIPMAFCDLKTLLSTPQSKCDICNRAAILPNGQVSICGIGLTVESLVVGNLKENNLTEIWNNATLFNYIRKNVPFNLKGVCQKCIHKKTCMGYCRAYAAMNNDGDILAPEKICQTAYEQGKFPESRIIG